MKSIAVNEAIENISEYLGSDNIYPYFVSVSGSNEYRLLLHRFASLKKVKVSEFCSADAYPDLDGFLDAVKEEHNEKLILGVGEYITCGGNIDILYSLKNLPSPKTVVLCRGKNRNFQNSTMQIVNSTQDVSAAWIPSLTFL